MRFQVNQQLFLCKLTVDTLQALWDKDASTRRYEMKTTTLYNIRAFNNNEHSRSLGNRLRTRKNATKLVRRLKKLGFDAFAAPVKVAA